MPTLFSHALVAAAMSRGVPVPPAQRNFWKYGMVCSMLPDADVVSFWFGIPYGHVLGHRGLSHSLTAAVAIGLIAAAYASGPGCPPDVRARLRWYFVLATASHGILDAMTNGGRGIAFFAPFDETRYFLPWQPIEVSPIGAAFFSARGWETLLSEIRWVWLPCAGLAVLLVRIVKGSR